MAKFYIGHTYATLLDLSSIGNPAQAMGECTWLLATCWMLQWQFAGTWGQQSTIRQVFYAVEMEGGIMAARALAQRHGLHFISRMGNLKGHYTLVDRLGRRKGTLEMQMTIRPGVKWVHRQQAQYREKRTSVHGLDHNIHKAQRQDDWAELPRYVYDIIDSENGLVDSLKFNDPYWPLQWELFNQGQFSSPKRFDLNVMPVWQRGITGQGVVVTIIDDGVDHTNEDLRKNFEAFASFDLRGAHGLSHDPMPLQDTDSGHGTRCAGEVAMEANNSFCGVGIAFNARIGGIRMLDGIVTDSMEATALTYNNHFIDIYLCCWGPKDDGMEMAGPGLLTQKALRLGAQKAWLSTLTSHSGRDGKGNIFVWASGNGGMAGDHCGADGYVNSIYSVAIGALTHTGLPAFFGEPCPAVMAVTLTGAGNRANLPLVTASNLDNGCVSHFTGTSSAAPIAAGIFALVLEANPDLTWRDIQHLITKTAKIPNPLEPGWSMNAAGYHFHDRYGFGLLDAGLMVQQALHFKTVPPQRNCSQEVTLHPVRILSPQRVVIVTVESNGCNGTDKAINVLEHVQVTVSITSVCRGDLSVELVSPSGTCSQLLGTRRNDVSPAGLNNWTLMSVQFWGEDPRGSWSLKVKDNNGTVAHCSRRVSEGVSGTVLSFTLTLHGTFDPRKSFQDSDQRGDYFKEKSQTFTAGRWPRPWKSPQGNTSPQALIQKKFMLENLKKINANDIPAPHQRKNLKLMFRPTDSFKPQDMDDTTGEAFRSHLKMLWNTLRDKVQAKWLLYNAKKPKQSPQLRWTNVALKQFLEDDPAVGVNSKERTVLKKREFIKEEGGTWSQLGSSTELLRAIAADIRDMQYLRTMLDLSGGYSTATHNSMAHDKS
ncbi:PC3-like endoprotease variant B [Arapaima gigas]